MRRYLIAFVTVASLLLGSLLLVNCVVDPYDFLGSPRIAHFNALKPYFGESAGIGKSFVMWRRQSSALVLGSSRENHGIDPEHPGWSAPAGARYNLGKEGAHIVEVEQLFEHAIAVADVKQVVIGLDFLRMFDGNLIEVEELDPSLLASATHSPKLAALNAGRYLVSWSMLQDSVRTVIDQDPALADYELDGRHNNVNFERNMRRAGGQHAAFLRSELTQYLGPRLALPIDERFSTTDSHGQLAVAHLARILDLAAEQHIDVRLIIAPVHARLLEMYRLMDLWPAFEDWKRSVVKIANGTLLRKTSTQFQIWDFSDYNEFTIEPLPPVGDSSARMQWFWEDTHYRKELGDLVLDQIFARLRPETHLPDYFGLLINEVDLDPYFAAIRNRSELYGQSHPADIAELTAVKARSLRCAARAEICPNFAKLPRLAQKEAALKK